LLPGDLLLVVGVGRRGRLAWTETWTKMAPTRSDRRRRRWLADRRSRGYPAVTQASSGGGSSASAHASFTKGAAMTEPQIFEPAVLGTIERYFELLQAHAPAEEMIRRVLTADFETGFTGGYLWRGPDGLAAFLADRSVFFDESHEILQLMDITQPAPDTIVVRTRLRFFLRRREPQAAVSEEFTGQAFHTWRLRRQPPDSDWRVAAQMVDGFAMLNDNAAALFAAPAEGLCT
jgi:hypothetical protein